MRHAMLDMELVFPFISGRMSFQESKPCAG
jgi:hypothetical protein